MERHIRMVIDAVMCKLRVRQQLWRLDSAAVPWQARPRWGMSKVSGSGGLMTVVDGLVVSGQRYRVTAVDGRRPAGLDHCVGLRVLTVDRDGLCHRLFGRGVEASGVFRFHQQDLGSDGTVVLVWTISDSGDGTLVIEPAADR